MSALCCRAMKGKNAIVALAACALAGGLGACSQSSAITTAASAPAPSASPQQMTCGQLQDRAQRDQFIRAVLAAANSPYGSRGLQVRVADQAVSLSCAIGRGNPDYRPWPDVLKALPDEIAGNVQP